MKNVKNFIDKYSCSQKCAYIAGKNQKTSLRKYGVNFPIQNKKIFDRLLEIKEKKYGDAYFNNPEKTKQTKLKNHGDENYNNRKQSEETKLKKYGNKNYNNPKSISKTYSNKSNKEFKVIYNKRKETNNKKFGVDNCFQSPELRKKVEKTKLEKYGNKYYNNRIKAEKTNLKKYGTNNVSQNSEIFEKQQKSAFKLKDYILPSGKIIKVQGYEPLALDLLLKIYKEEDLLIDNKDIEKTIGKIWYNKENNKRRRYYPDIYIISENKIIEVKSTWTYKCKKDNIFLKKQKCLEMNMRFEFMIFNEKKQLLSEQEVKELIK